MQHPIILIVPSFANAAPVRMAFELANELRTKQYAVSVAALRLSRRHTVQESSEFDLLFGFVHLFRYLLRLLLRHETILIHTHGLRPDAVGLLLKCIFPGKVTWVATMHNDVKEDLRFAYGVVGKLVAPIWLRLVMFSDRVVFLNDYLLDKYRAKFGAGKAVSIRNGRLNKDDCPSMTRAALLNPDYLVVGFLGALTPLKRIVPLAQALRELSGVSLTVAGTGPLLESVQDIYRDSDRFRYLGHVDDIASFFAQIDVLVLPSVSEGFPLVVPEALAHSVPCVLTHLEQYRSLYGKKGVLFIDDISTESLRQVFEILCQDYAAFSTEARRLWTDELTAHAMADQYDRLYMSARGCCIEPGSIRD